MHEQQTTPRGGTFHLWHNEQGDNMRKRHIPQKEITFDNEPFALVQERAEDGDKRQAEAEAAAVAQQEAQRIAAAAQGTFAL